MLDILFGWRKASKCKKLIRHVQCRLKLLKNKRGSITRQLREDVAQLLKLGQEQSAFSRVEQLFKDQTLLSAYDLLDHFCEFITIQLPYIRRHRECPNDINEAVSSLIFAAARCGDLPELQTLRKLFGERYGHKFSITAAELLVGNLVDCQIIEKLTIKSVPDDVKLGLLDEITREYSIQRETIRILDRFELQNQQVYNLPEGNKGPQFQIDERDTQLIYHSTEGADIKASNYEYTQGKAPSSSFPVCRNCQSHNLNLTCTSSTAIIVAQPRIDTLDPFLSIPIHKNAVRAEKQGELNPSCKPRMIPKVNSSQRIQRGCSSICISNPSQQHEMERTTTAPENSLQFPEMSVVYLDDIEEVNPTIQDGLGKNQRVFMFKSINMPTRENLGTGIACLSDLYGYSRTEEQTEPCEPWDGKAQSRISRMRTRSSQKILNRRSLFWGTQVPCSSKSPSLSKNDVESALYYGDHCDYSPNENSPRHKTKHPKRHQRKITEESWNSKFKSHKKKLQLPRQDDDTWEVPKELFGEEEEKHSISSKYSWRSFSGCRIDCDMGFNCSLKHPCYFFTSDGKDAVENMCLKQYRGIQAGVGFPSHNFQQGFSTNEEAYKGTTAMNHRSYGHTPDYKAIKGNIQVQDMGWDTFPQRDCQYMASSYAVTDSKNQMSNMRSMKEERVEQEVISDFQSICASSHGSCSYVASPLTQRFRQPPYLRAQTMPPERPKNTATDKISRSASCEFKQTNHSNGTSSSSSSSHVHPKLPDYDDLAAKFMALKKERLQSTFQSG
ncbi:hypothetical protein NE237_032050 [Protea cynaroides]|uniref:Uncharacterized protein n=1 Tax=Protea cynaroides TaxID=273540 RepID=A0A9Q0L2D4_9MAGN|nr:hypothetical protein NE237_032050 [Protea cynaroides]